MYRLFVWPVALSLLLFTLLAVTARTVGSIQPTHPALANFHDDCQSQIALCWNELQPGITSKEAAYSIVENIGYKGYDNHNNFQFQFRTTQLDPGCLYIGYSVGGDDSHIANLMVGCSTLTLGDVISFWGTPEQVGYEPVPLPRIYITYRDPDGRLKAKISLRPFASLSAYATIDLITLAWRLGTPNDVSRWHGFLPLWRYCQLESTFGGCK